MSAQGNYQSPFRNARAANLARIQADPRFGAFAGSRDINLGRINADPRFAAPALAAPAPAAPARSPAPAAAPAVATAPVKPTTGSGAADLEQTGSLLGALAGGGFPAQLPAHLANPQFAVATPEQQKVMTGPADGDRLEQALSGVQPVEQDLETRRRRAFLDGEDSMAGMRAVRNVLAEEVTRRGGTPAAAPQATVRGLEKQLAGLGPAKGLGKDGGGNWTASNDAAGEAATLEAIGGTPAAPAAPAFAVATVEQQKAMAGPAPGALAPAPLAPSGNLPQAQMNAWLQSDSFKQRVRDSSLGSLAEIAPWQVSPQAIPAPREVPGRSATLAAFGAMGEAPPTTPGEAVLAVGAGNAFGTRAGQFKPGNTVNLGMLDPSKLPPLNSTGHYSGYNPGNFNLF